MVISREPAVSPIQQWRRALTSNYLGGGRNDPAVTQSFVDHAPAALRFFAETAQVPFYMVDKLPDHYYPAGAGSIPFGRSHQVRPFEASSLGSWQKHLDITPYRHGRVTFEEMAARGGMAGQWDKALLAGTRSKRYSHLRRRACGLFSQSRHRPAHTDKDRD